MLSVKEQSEILDEYMSFRAECEDVAYQLTPAFFEEALRFGCRSFFGIVLSEEGEIVGDTQNPMAFREWRRDKDFVWVRWKASPGAVMEEVDALLRKYNLCIEHYDGDTGSDYEFRVVELNETA